MCMARPVSHPIRAVEALQWPHHLHSIHLFTQQNRKTEEVVSRGKGTRREVPSNAFCAQIGCRWHPVEE